MDPTIEWTKDDEFVLDGITYDSRSLPTPGLRSSDDRFFIMKPRWQIERYEQLFKQDAPKNIFELGIWDGGSTAFIAQLARPRKLVAVDLKPVPCAALANFIQKQGLSSSVVPYYGVDQADQQRLSEIVDRDFRGEALDLVVDDASHQVIPTRASFNVLFPLVKPGGTYLIEDWSWAHNVAIPENAKEWTPLTLFILELMFVCAHHPTVIEEIVLKKGSAFVRRGPANLDPKAFDVATSYGKAGQKMMSDLTRG